MTESVSAAAHPPTAKFADDHISFKPDEFTIVRVDVNGQPHYVISFIEHVFYPNITREDSVEQYGLRVDRIIKSTITVPAGLLDAMRTVAADVDARTFINASPQAPTQNS